MELLRGLLFALFVLYNLQADVGAQSAQVTTKNADTEKELRMMLKTVLEQNRRLSLQNNRLQQVWLGIQQMCKAVTMSNCNCSEPHVDVSNSASNGLPLQIHTIMSTGVTSETTTLKISYTATPDHTTQLIGWRSNDGMLRTAGTKTQDMPGSLVFTTQLDVHDLSSMRYMLFSIFSENESLQVQFNLTEVEMAQEQKVVAPSTGFLEVNSSYWAPKDSDLNITTIVNKDASDSHEFEDFVVTFTGINTSASPPEMFERFSVNPKSDIGLSLSRRTDTTSYMNISLRYPYVQFGGILYIRMPCKESKHTGMVEKMFYGPFIKIYPLEAEYVVPYNKVGLFPVANQTIIFPPTQSIACAAMGNPRPEVSMLKITKDGKTMEIPTETVILNSYMNFKVLTLSSKQPKRTEGRYICRASSGNQTIDAPTEVIVLKPAVFDETKTGVIKNTSDQIVISCKAKGKPAPQLSLRLNGEYGSDLMKSGIYKVKKSDKNPSAARVTLSISPVESPDLHTVYCVASQGGPNQAFELFRKIEILPGMQNETNWDLYHRLR